MRLNSREQGAHYLSGVRSKQRLLRRIYKNQARLGAWEAAANTALDLGMALRDNTRFQEALKLYKNIGGARDKLPGSVQARLNLQVGIIYKNLAQRGLREVFPRQGATDARLRQRELQADKMLGEALAYNMQALDWAESTNSLGLLIEAINERSECLLIASRRDDASLPQAELLMDRLEMLLQYLPTATRLVDFEKHRGIALWLRGNVVDAMLHVERGRQIALDHGLLFKACDCDYQIGLQVLTTLSSLRDTTYLRQGLAALQRAIEFYRANVLPTNEYLANVVRWKRELEEEALQLGLSRA